jgi:hypothetical protein
MPVTHASRRPVVIRSAPIDPDSTDWVFFSYENWLHTGESIDSHEALIVGGTIVTDSVLIGDLTDTDDVTYANTYGVQFSVDEGECEVSITHRVSTSTVDSPSLSRLNIDHTVTVPVVSL